MGRYVLLNSQRYLLKGDLIRFKQRALADAVRTSGRVRQESLTQRQSLVLPAPTDGMGLRRIPTDRIDDPTMHRRTWRSRADTRFDSGVTLPILRQDTAEPTLTGDSIYSCRVFQEFASNLYGFFDGEDIATAQGGLYAASFTPSTWGTATLVAGSGTSGEWFIPLSATTVNNYLVVLAARGDDHLFYRRTATGAWAAATTQPTAALLVNNVTQSERIFAGAVTSLGNTLYAFLWDEDNDEIEAWQSTNQGDVWTAIAGAVVSPGGGPRGAVAYIDLNGDTAPCFSATDGIYALDTSASAIQKLVAYPSNGNSGQGLTRWANPVTGLDGIYCGLGDGNLLEYVYISSGSNNRSFAQTVGLNEADGVATTERGYITAMYPTSRWLFYSTGGDASGRNSWIGAYDGKGSRPEMKGAGHHYMAHDLTANRQWGPLIVSAEDDDTMRLHYNIRVALSAESAVTFDASSSGTATPLSHTCTGANRLILAWVNRATTPATGVTYGGVAMTQVGTNQSPSGINFNAWRLIAPATGANDIAVTGGSGNVTIMAISSAGVNQTTPLTNVVESNAGAGTSATAAVAGRTNAITVCGVTHSAEEAHTPNAGDTERQEVSIFGQAFSCNTEVSAATGNTTVGASWATSASNAIIAVSVMPVAPTTGDNTEILAEPLVSFDSGVTRNYGLPSAGNFGFIERPETNMGMPRDDAAFIGVFVEGRALDSTITEFINENRAIDGAAGFTDIGDIISGTQELLMASGAGVSGRSIQLREELNRGGANVTSTPLLVATEIMYVKHIPPLNGWRFTVDLENAESPEQRPMQDMLDNLETALTNVPRQAFQPRIGGTTYYVTVEILGWTEKEGYEDGGPYEAGPPPRVASVELRLTEVV